ncbi:alpha/beta hydrolase [Flavobacterium noncentrifugens]|uniref:Pimeloyl-ACP methyl ester carboxylesterase n=1 Tax=Flavobacterium noncentrifugens TaxID=1128970 RepID=A0A1G9D9I0_9FLAO|nr:alpha/beta hydrolase [Flavobacterium noncentrifugens]GEP52553.1 alpha/beta hydrolase [Flavobacterium noncentrifugens]SDK60531.1 Pimeloyl-ACP methyl ester carboxylesterase [Flavobacterium noncentrifugens]
MAKKSKKAAQSLKIPKFIIASAKFLAFISPKLAVLFAARLFTTPMKHKIPKREIEMDANSLQKTINIPSIQKDIVVYKYGTSDKKTLLVHGWSGRGTQLVKFADELIKQGYSTISFDAPAHGKSEGKTTIMTEFIESILEIEKQFGPFEAAIGHSLGGMSSLNAVKRGLKINHLVTIGSGDIVSDIIDDFILQLGLKHKFSALLREHFEKKIQQSMDSYSAYIAAGKTEIPVLVIHDNDDEDVPVKAGIHIHKHLKNGQLMITKGLGHRKILGNDEVIQKTINFIKN